MSSRDHENNEEAEALISDNDSQELNIISSDDKTFTESDDESHVKKLETDVGIPLELHYIQHSYICLLQSDILCKMKETMHRSRL